MIRNPTLHLEVKMKTLHVVALVALLSVVGHAQSNSSSPQAQPNSQAQVNSPSPQPQRRTMADATHALKGPVKFFRSEASTFVLKDGEYVEGPKELREEAWFNRDGNRTDYHIYNNGLLVRRIVMKYEGRKMLECINYDGHGNAWLRIVNTFDEQGRMKEQNTYNGDGSLRSTKTVKLNSRGQVIQVTETSARGLILEQIYNKYEGQDLYTSERKVYNPTNGTLTHEALYVAPNKRTEINYKPDGSVASKSVRVGQEMAHYGPDGSLRKATVIAPEDRLLDEMMFKQDGPTTRNTELPDVIDQHGNWTRQTKWFADPSGTRPLRITYRALTYYDN